MLRKAMSGPIAVPVVLILQLVPLVIFPLESYNLGSQEWWLPVLLSVFALVAIFKLLVRRSHAQWPWYLLSFSQGFNIISRLMMAMPHATSTAQGGGIVINSKYLVITFVAMALSAFMIWYCELPEVRKRVSASAAARRA